MLRSGEASGAVNDEDNNDDDKDASVSYSRRLLKRQNN